MTESSQPVTATSRTGSIYDLGYRRYEGPRLGRAYAIRALAVDSLRTAYGIGHGGRAKIAPIVLGAIALLPAIIVVGAIGLVSRLGARDQLEGASPITYDSYYSSISAVIALFCAAQAPELFSRDQRHGVIALYFARAIRRADYALARFAGFGVALLILLLLPMAVLLLGRVLLSTDVAAAFGDDLPKLPAVVAQALVTAGLFGSLSMAVAAFTPRRAYAIAGIIALFLIPGVLSGIVIGLGSGGIGNVFVLLSPGLILDGTSALFFGKALPDELASFDLPMWTFLASAILVSLVAGLVVVRRFLTFAT
jgi:ABC-2 type transport system permease protein